MVKKYTKANVKPEIGQVIDIIAANEGIYVYNVIEQAIRHTYPTYFNNRVRG
jgi:hypothetical protein